MSPRDIFWFLAGALAGLAVTLIARAWTRAPVSRSPAAQDTSPGTQSAPSGTPSAPAAPARNTIPAFAVPVAAALGLIAVALGIYFLIGSPDSIASEKTSTAGRTAPHAAQATSQTDSNGGSMEEVTRRLAARLAASGGSDDDWRLLEQSYEYMGRTEDAEAARKHLAKADGVEPEAATDSGGGGGTAAHISGQVTLAPALAARAGTNAVLFIYAKQPNVPGPPLAVRRLQVDRWPVAFDLDDSNSMVPGRTLSAAGTVEVEARISMTGEALPRAGDLTGRVAGVDTHHASNVTVLIDHEFGH